MWTKMGPVWLLKPPHPGPQIAKDVNVFHIWKTYYIPEIWNFGDVMVLVWTQPPHAKACVSRNCDTNERIKFISDTAIDDLEWKNPIDFGANRKNQNGRRRPFCEIWCTP